MLLQGEDTYSAETDAEGLFRFPAVKPGVYSLRVTREGYAATTERDIVVRSGQLAERNVQLAAEVVELDEFVGILEEENLTDAALSLDLKEDLDSLASVLGAELFSRGGISDVGGALKKLAGTSVVDSRYVVVRGLSDRYNVIVLNGMRIPSSDPDRRAVNVDIFPTALVDNIIASKTFTPDLPGETTGGFIDIITKRVPEKPFFKASFSFAYNTASTGNRDFVTYKGGGTGFLGNKSVRDFPGFLKGTGTFNLPRNQLNVRIPPLNTIASLRAFRAYNLQNDTAAYLKGTTMGTTTATAPPDFSFNASGGTSFDFFGRPLGLVAGVSYKKDYRLKTGIRGNTSISAGAEPSASYSSLLRVQEGEQSLLSALLLGATFEPWDEHFISATIFSNIAVKDTASFQIGEAGFAESDPNDNIPFEDERFLFIRESISYIDRRLRTIQLTGDHTFEDERGTKVKWGAAYSESSEYQPDQRFANYTFTRETRSFDQIIGNDFAGSPFERIWRRFDDFAYNVNFSVDTRLDRSADKELESRIKFGGSFEHGKRDFIAEYLSYSTNTGFYPTWPSPGDPVPSDRKGQTLGDLLPTVDLSPAPQFTNPITGVITVPAVFNRNYIFRQDLPSPTESYQASQTFTAGFVQSKFHLSPQFEILAGARVENTDIQLRPGFNASQVSDSTPVLIDPVTGNFFRRDQVAKADLRRTDLLPVLATNWSFAKDMSLRTAVTRTVARPSFKELAPAFQREPGGTRYIIGNPQLNLSSIVNYDIRYEWLPGGADLFAVGLFSKTIDAPLELFNIGRYYKWGNEPSAIVYGFELEGSKDLGTIWENLDGFSTNFNYGYIFSGVSLSPSSSNRRQSAGLSSVRRLQGQPDYTFNYDVSYSNQEFGLSASILLNVTGNLLYAVGASDGQALFGDIFQRPFTSLDFTLSKKLGDHAKLSFKVSNLLNEKRRRTVSPGGLPEVLSEEGVTFSLGLSGDW